MRPNQSLEHVTTHPDSDGEILQQDRRLRVVQATRPPAWPPASRRFYQKVKIGHIERAADREQVSPYPEEVNRRIIDSVSDLYFAPTEQAKQNLLQEGVPGASIAVTGNTVIDALLQTARRISTRKEQPWKAFPGWQEAHSAHGASAARTSAGRCRTSAMPSGASPAVCRGRVLRLPGPPHPNVQEPVHSLLGDVPNIFLTEPLDYLPFVQLIREPT